MMIFEILLFLDVIVLRIYIILEILLVNLGIHKKESVILHNIKNDSVSLFICCHSLILL